MPDVSRPVLFCGENPGLTLYAPASNDAIAVASYWHCTHSPLGNGHALVLWLDPRAVPDRHWRGGIFADNLPLARMLVENLTQHFPEFHGVPVTDLPYMTADCHHTSDGARSYTVQCASGAERLAVAWLDPLDHKQIRWPSFPAGPAAYDLTTVICPCRHATITINGHQIAGEVKTADRDGWPSSSAFLAFAETWVGPVSPNPAL
jgi:hypothetical protein